METTIKGINGKAKIKEWVEKGIDKDAIIYAENFGIELVNNHLTTSQIRLFFGEIKRIEMRGLNATNAESSLLLLKPKLAYAEIRKSGVSTNAGKAAKAVREILSIGIDTVLDGNNEEIKEQRFQNFISFFEAIIAYHRANGGK